MSLGKVAARGAGTVMAGQLARVILQVASVAILTRLIDPTDYGLFTAGMLLVGFGEVFRDFGLSTAAIQAKSLTNAQRDTLFWMNVALGATFSAAMALLAPLAAWWFGAPELTNLARLLGLVFLLNGAVAQYRASLNRTLRFNALVLSDLGANLVGVVVAVSMAATGWSYWSLVGQSLAGGVALLAFTGLQAGWLPGLPRRGTGVRSMVRYGAALVASQLVSYLNNNFDNMVIGTRMGLEPLGLYSRAYQLLMRTVNQFRVPTTTVALPVLSRLEGQDRNDAFVLAGQKALGYAIVPLIAVAGACAVPIVAIFTGPKFQAIATPFAILAIASAFQTVAYVGYWVYLARGLTKHLLTYSLIGLAGRAMGILIGSNWGIVGVAIGFAVSEALLWPISIWWLSRYTPMPVRSLYAGAFRVLGVAAVAGGAGYLAVSAAVGLPSIVQLIIGVVVVAAGYLAAAIVPAFRRDYQEVYSFARLALPSRSRGGER